MGIKGEKFDKEDDEIEENTNNEKQISILKNIIFIVLGIIMLKIGGDFVVDNATFIAEHFNISEQIISLTIVAIGTSLPELVTSVVAAIKGNSDISIGNILGSNIFNMTFIIGIASLIKPITYNIEYNVDLIVLLIASIGLFLFQYIPPKNMMSKRNGVIYLAGYVIYMISMFVS
jgi:cation:H+ antiporter